MNNFIDPEYASRLMAYAASGFVLVMLFSVTAALVTIKTLTGRRITFMIVTWSLFLVFFVVFYGLNYMMRKFWGLEATLGSTAIDILSLAAAVGLMSLLALYWKISIPEGPSLQEVEQENLKEEEMTPMDFARRDHMTRHRYRRK
ncbi:MAG TPA: hypothetical protein VHL11_24005 [Phototrophicaceae bacterium]|jgi:hypothetical protein|nr:hypothetical protein [Phototrophicaceae bacterium]